MIEDSPKSEGEYGGDEYNEFGEWGNYPIFISPLVERARKKLKIPKDWKAYCTKDQDIIDNIMLLKHSKDFVSYFNDTESIMALDEAVVGDSKLKVDRVEGVIKNKNFTILTLTTFPSRIWYAFVFCKKFEDFTKNFKRKPAKLKKGIYRLIVTPIGVEPKKLNLSNCPTPVLNNNLLKMVNSELKSFRGKEEIYKAHKMDYKRGIMLYGVPGCGKTTLIKYLLSKLKNSIAVIVNSNQSSEISFIYDKLKGGILGDGLKIIVFEDIDAMESWQRSKLLNLLDGLVPVHNVLFIATTNFPSKLDSAIKDRPSRFDAYFEIEKPNEESRLILLESFFGKLKENKHKAVKETKGMSGAHFKEIFLLSQLYNCSMMKAIAKIKERFSKFAKFTKEQSYLG